MRWRMKHGLTTSQLSNLLGVRDEALIAMERGKNRNHLPILMVALEHLSEQFSVLVEDEEELDTLVSEEIERMIRDKRYAQGTKRYAMPFTYANTFYPKQSRWLRTKVQWRCATCGGPLQIGDTVFSSQITHSVYCGLGCGQRREKEEELGTWA